MESGQDDIKEGITYVRYPGIVTGKTKQSRLYPNELTVLSKSVLYIHDKNFK